MTDRAKWVEGMPLGIGLGRAIIVLERLLLIKGLRCFFGWHITLVPCRWRLFLVHVWYASVFWGQHRRLRRHAWSVCGPSVIIGNRWPILIVHHHKALAVTILFHLVWLNTFSPLFIRLFIFLEVILETISCCIRIIERSLVWVRPYARITVFSIHSDAAWWSPACVRRVLIVIFIVSFVMVVYRATNCAISTCGKCLFWRLTLAYNIRLIELVSVVFEEFPHPVDPTLLLKQFGVLVWLDVNAFLFIDLNERYKAHVNVQAIFIVKDLSDWYCIIDLIQAVYSIVCDYGRQLRLSSWRDLGFVSIMREAIGSFKSLAFYYCWRCPVVHQERVRGVHSKFLQLI